MKRAVISVVIMALSSFIGLIVGGLLNNDVVGGMILFALIAGIACIIYVLDNQNNK